MRLPTLTKAALAALLVLSPMTAFAQDAMGVDDGTQLTLWTRAATQVRVDQLVQAYNATHKNQITATYVVTDDYQTKVGAAAAANGLPDLFSADVVFMPNWTSAGLFQDITDRINNMPGIENVAQAGHRRRDLGRQEIRHAVHRRPLGLDVEQEALQAGWPRSRKGPDLA